MEKIYLILLVTMGMGLCLAAPVTTNKKITFFNTINGTCSNATQLQQKQKEIFDSCKEFSNATIGKDNIFCGLYLDRVTSYCTKFPKISNYSTLADMQHFNYTMEDVCKSITEYTNNSMKPFDCFLTCLRRTNEVKLECLYAHHYNVLSQTPIISTNGAQSSAGSSVNANLNPPGHEADTISDVKENRDQKHPNSDEHSNAGHEIQPPANPAVIGTNGNELPAAEQPNNDNKPKEEKPATSQTNKVASSAIASPNNQDALTNQDPPRNQDAPTNQDPDASSKKQEPPAPANNQEAPSPNNESVPAPNGEPNNESVPAAKGEPEDKPTKTKGDQPGTDPEEEDDGQHGIPEDGDDYTDLNALENPPKVVQEEHKEKKPDVVQENPINSENLDEVDGESYFFSYFMVVCVLFVLGYVGYHNRIKVMALLLEGKRNKRQHRGRRPNSANYHKLDSNLEEAISSNVTKNSNNVIY